MIRVILVDDSATVRRLFKKALSSAPDVQVIAEAPDPYVARALVVEHKPDVLVLDVEMPRMDGITFLRKLTKHFPIPVVVCSSVTEAGGKLALEAFDAGALEVICKPQTPSALAELGSELLRAVRGAAASRRTSVTAGSRPVELGRSTSVELVVLGASTGGTTAVESIISRLPPQMPPIVVVQHMPAYITKAFAARLNGLSRLQVFEATDGHVLEPGQVLIAPGDHHLEIVRAGRDLRCRLNDHERVNGHRPAVDVMFHSVARNVGANVVGALLTGMGKDGAQGMLEMRERGAYTLAQDEKSCVVFGMPRAAIELGAACEVAALDEMAPRLVRALETHAAAQRRSRLPAATGRPAP
jgi:two-component system chemotaxis response regulator CheB